ncbi:MAG: maleylacetoacetate isomerase [Woeseiaceae bacterium]
MHQAEITLYGYYFSSTSYRARILLNLKQLTYDTIDIRLDKGAQHDAEFKSLNPMGAVPVLKVGELSLVQSQAISDYLDETYPEPRLVPLEAEPRQRVREITALISCDIHPVNNLRVLKHLRSEHQFDDSKIAAWYRLWIEQGFGALESLLQATSDSGRFCVGDMVSMADVFLIPQIANARRFDIPLDQYPTIVSIDKHCQTIPAFADAHPSRHVPADKQ